MRPSGGARSSASTCPSSRRKSGRCCSARSARFVDRAAAVGIEKLLDLAAMEDPSQIALMGLLMHCLPAAFQTDQESYALLCCTMVRLSLEHGNCALSARAYGSFAALLSSAVGRVRRSLSLREARRRPCAQARRDVDVVRRLFSVGDVRLALGQARRRKRRSVRASRPFWSAKRRPRACRLQRRSPPLAPAGARHAAGGAARGRARCARDPAPHQRCSQPGVPAAAPRAHRLALRRAEPRQHARHGRARRGGRGPPRFRHAAIARSRPIGS